LELLDRSRHLTVRGVARNRRRREAHEPEVVVRRREARVPRERDVELALRVRIAAEQPVAVAEVEVGERVVGGEPRRALEHRHRLRGVARYEPYGAEVHARLDEVWRALDRSLEVLERHGARAALAVDEAPEQVRLGVLL